MWWLNCEHKIGIYIFKVLNNIEIGKKNNLIYIFNDQSNTNYNTCYTE